MNRSRQSSGTRPANWLFLRTVTGLRLAQRDGAVLADHLAADVVAVADVDGDLDVDQGAAGHLQQQEQRVLQARRRCGSSAGLSTAVATISSPNIQRTMSISCTAVSVIAMSLV